MAEWGVLVTRAELLKFLPFGLAATHASRAGGSTGCFGRESMLGIYIDGPSRSCGPAFETRSEAWMPLSGGINFVD